MDTIDERAERIIKRTISPKEKITHYYLSENFEEKIINHNYLVKKMIENPYETYLNFKLRLEQQGADAEFPEFEGVVGFLIKSIFQNPVIYSFFEKVEYKILIEQLIHKLIGLEIEERFNYPYRATIYCIESLLELLDFYYRTVNLIEGEQPIDVDLQVNEKIGPYYHIFRYRSYMTVFTDSKEYGIPNNIIFPTCVNIGAIDLIKLRCVPILIMGIANKPIYIDQYLNTPLDFWAHDIQHAKRQIQETERYFDSFIKHNQYYQRRTVFDIVTSIKFYKYMETFTKTKILPLITIDKSDNEITQAKKNIYKLIIFEVIHEKAWPITIKSLCRNIPLRYDEFPVENLTYNESKNKVTSFHYLFSDPTTIANVLAKIRGGFYDKTNSPKNYIIQDKYRKSGFVAKYARELMIDIGCKNIPSEEYFLALVTDKHALQEFQDVKQIDIPDDIIDIHEYPLDEPKNNLFDDTTLTVGFIPKVSIANTEEQAKLHKQSEVVGYDDSFEKINNKYLKYKNKYLKLKNKI
jgi:hypothetical protein